MYSAEVLSQLRSLNWLAQEVRRVPPASLEGLHIQDQIGAVRARLPNSILSYHDRLASRGQPSVVAVRGTGCSGCHLKLPRGLLGELALAGRFSVCPNCGVFLWSGEEPAKDFPKNDSGDTSGWTADDAEVVPPVRVSNRADAQAGALPSAKIQNKISDSVSSTGSAKLSAPEISGKASHV